MNQSLNLINQLIELEIERDTRWKDLMVRVGRGHEAIGESAMLTHLKNLRILVEEESLVLQMQVGNNIKAAIDFKEDGWPEE